MKLLRLEGVNLANCVFDTEDLSTRRGGSLMLLDAVNFIAKEFKNQLEPISTGASTGLFKVTGQQDNLVKNVQDKLQKHELYRFGTFVVDLAEGEFKTAIEKVLTLNRWQQMQGLSFSSIGLSENENRGPCVEDGIRPASNEKNSVSVQTRRDYGVEQKQHFYNRLLQEGSNRRYTRDFEILASDMQYVDTPNLEGKLAVFYADGNKFGKVGVACKTPDELKKWDQFVKDERKKLLEAIVAHACKYKRWQTSEGQIRLETLLWGGDELMFVVPGWCGLQLANLFFEQTQHMVYDGKKLTHACGLVFCHHQAPISAITTLAKNLADKAKEGKSNFKEKNSLNWIVLESFDQAGSDLDGFLKTRYHDKVKSWDALTLHPEAVKTLHTKMAGLKKVLPKSTMVRALRLLVENETENKLLERSYQSVEKAIKKEAETTSENDAANPATTFKELWKELHPNQREWMDKPSTQLDSNDYSDLVVWIKMLELWDYCQPHETPEKGNSNTVVTSNNQESL
jgi:hypothetical protein